MHIPDLSEPAKVDSDCRNVIHILDPSEGPMVQKTWSPLLLYNQIPTPKNPPPFFLIYPSGKI